MAASTSASTATADDSHNNNCYDVFISHRGPDVKKTFASHLYRRLISYGLRVFLDYQELQEGEELTCQIKGAIRGASIHIAIFSPRYAESEWCLDELVHMLESRAPIIPVFHHVRPAEVRRTRGEGVYARSLSNLEKKRGYDSLQPRYDSKTIDNWRNALSRVADISGLDLEALNGDEGELLDKVVEAVLRKGFKTQLNVARYPTGLEEKVKDFESKVTLQQHCGRVQIIGITGIGGVGKTTLAKELFNRKSSNYSKSCFLFDIRENAKSSLHSLQSKLLKDLLGLNIHIGNRDQGIEMLRKHLSSSQILLVLDDVDDVEQVYALLPVDDLCHGSLILITSRDKNILQRSGVQERSIYKLNGLNRERSRELFCSHAFCQPHPLSGFGYLDKFLKACDGLPLSLKVIGGLLYGNSDMSYWKDELDILEKTLPYEIQKRLHISYDALQREEQQIFLDIACFFIGEKRDTAIAVWDASGWKGSRGFQSLQNKCLVEVDIHHDYRAKPIEFYIRMHDHLRDLGRDLAKGSTFPCRLWCGTKHMEDLLQQSSEATKVRGIRMLRKKLYYNDAERESSYDRASFSRYKMKELQLLDIDINEDLLKCILRAVVSPKLIWLRWQNCPCSSLPSSISLKELRVLQVSGDQLKTLWPEELQAPSQLRVLHIAAPLSDIPNSIGQLKHLEQLVVKRGDFRKLPEEFGHLLSLKHLEFSHISRLRSLPEFFGNLTKLELIGLYYCVKLKSIQGLAQLAQLRKLYIRGCDKLEELPGLEHLRSLESLLAIWMKLKSIRFSAQQTQLRELEVSLCNELEELSGLEHLSSLEELSANYCRNLKRIQFSARQTQLRNLSLDKCDALDELPGHEHLSSLEKLCADGCVNLKRVLFSAQQTQLRNLSVDKCDALDELPGLEHLSSLEKLSADECVNMKRIRFSAQQTQLRNISVDKCDALEELPGLEHLSSLEKLSADECVNLKSIRFGTQPTQLREPYFSGCSELEELQGLEHLWSLEELWASGCVKLKSIHGLQQLSQLRELYVSGCSELEDLPGLEHLRSLENLCADGCVKMKTIRFSGQQTQLRNLSVEGCDELEELPGLEHLSSLEKLCADECVKLKIILFSAQQTQLKKLSVDKCYELEELPGHEKLSSLENLCADECVKLKRIRFSAQQTQLRNLCVDNCYALEELPGLENLISVEKLCAEECVNLKRIPFSEQQTQLRNLSVDSCYALEELPGLEHLSSLEKLSADECVNLKSIRFSAKLTQLRELYVSGCVELEELRGLEHLWSLEELWASECVKLKSIQGLQQLSELRELHVSGCSELEELPGLEHLRSLKRLGARECVKLKSICFSAQLTTVRALHVDGCSELEALLGLEHLRSLEEFWASECVKLKSIQGLQQLTELRKLDVSGCSNLEVMPGPGLPGFLDVPI